MRCVEQAADTRMVVSVSDRTLQILDRTITLEIPDPMREALLNGHWDPSCAATRTIQRGSCRR